jgi:hypothetical protein
MVLPEGNDDQAAFLDQLGERSTPGIDFFLSALVSGLVFALALLLDSPALLVLAALLSPFMGPVVGVPIATIAGSAGYLARSLGSLLISGLIFFLTGTLGGWAARIYPPASLSLALYHTRFNWPSILLLTVGAILTLVLMARAGQSRPLVSSVAVAYAVYAPLSAAGFGLTSGVPIPWAGGLLVFLVHLVWTALTGTLALAILGLRPIKLLSYMLSVGYTVFCVGGLFLFLQVSPLAAQPAPESAVPALQSQAVSQPSPTSPPAATAAQAAGSTLEPVAVVSLGSATPSPRPSATNTLVPTRTATITVTPQATPVWARINAKGSNGILIRKEPHYDADVVQSVLNGIIVQVLPDVAANDGVTWVKVRTADGKEGWVVRSLLATATPAPGW